MEVLGNLKVYAGQEHPHEAQKQFQLHQDSLGRIVNVTSITHAVGRRKTSVARVYMKPGQGKIVINKRDIDEYYIRATSKMIINQPLELTENAGKMDILVNVTGGGLLVKSYPSRYK